jgi:hypothetical protein
MAMRTFLKAIPRNFRAAYFTLCMPASLLGWGGHASATEPVVIHGSDTFTFEIVSNRPGCPAATSVSTSDRGSGRSTHLGRYTFIAGERINLSTPEPEVTLGFFTLTAEDGSTISGNYSGNAEYTDATKTSVLYAVSGFITAGSGHFQNLTTGTFAFLGGANLSTGTGFDSIAGNIYTAAASSPDRDR